MHSSPRSTRRRMLLITLLGAAVPVLAAGPVLAQPVTTAVDATTSTPARGSAAIQESAPRVTAPTRSARPVPTRSARPAPTRSARPAATRLTISVSPATLPAAKGIVTIRGRLTRRSDGAALKGVPVQIYGQPALSDSWTRITRVTTDRRGRGVLQARRPGRLPVHVACRRQCCTCRRSQLHPRGRRAAAGRRARQQRTGRPRPRHGRRLGRGRHPPAEFRLSYLGQAAAAVRRRRASVRHAGQGSVVGTAPAGVRPRSRDRA